MEVALEISGRSSSDSCREVTLKEVVTSRLSTSPRILQPKTAIKLLRQKAKKWKEMIEQSAKPRKRTILDDY
jgi:hypothetical protein